MSPAQGLVALHSQPQALCLVGTTLPSRHFQVSDQLACIHPPPHPGNLCQMHGGHRKCFKFCFQFSTVLRHNQFLLLKKRHGRALPCNPSWQGGTARKRPQGLLPLTGGARCWTPGRPPSSEAAPEMGPWDPGRMTKEKVCPLPQTHSSGQKTTPRLWGKRNPTD